MNATTTKNIPAVLFFTTIATIVGLVCLFVNKPSTRPQGAALYAAPSLPFDTMVVVPSGPFWMGSDTGEIDERPIHKIELDSFYIDVFPITNSFYAQFLRETGHKKPKYWDDPKCNNPRQPVVGVSFHDAVAFCNWRSKKDSASYRLPTEAEWEKAARSDDQRVYPWGNDKPTEKRATTEITEKMPMVGMCDLGLSPYGVSDMVGNVWNWCLDIYNKDSYKNSPPKNPQGPKEGKHRVVRGGNWVFLGCCSGTPTYALRATRRNSFHENIQKKTIGFRCVRER